MFRRRQPTIFIAPDIPSPPRPQPPILKEPGSLRLVFVSRVAPMKNLHGALDILATVHGDAAFDIYGPREDAAYWQKCEASIARLPPTIQVEYRGELAPADVPETIGRYHALFLPTRGENYGHVIAEALGAARLVLISDRTRWRHLQLRGFGWDLPLDDIEGFRRAIYAMLAMGQAEFTEMVAWIQYKWPGASDIEGAIAANRHLFTLASREGGERSARVDLE